MTSTGGRLASGQVFAFVAGERRHGCGQIVCVDRSRLPLVAIFRPLFTDGEASAVTVLASPVALLVGTFDVLLKRGDWRVIGEGPVVRVPELVFRVAIGSMDDVYLESYDRTRRRRALASEIPLVPNRTSVSPKGVERLFLAIHGLAESREGDYVHAVESITKRATLLEPRRGPTSGCS